MRSHTKAWSGLLCGSRRAEMDPFLIEGPSPPRRIYRIIALFWVGSLLEWTKTMFKSRRRLERNVLDRHYLYHQDFPPARGASTANDYRHSVTGRYYIVILASGDHRTDVHDPGAVKW